MGMLRLAMSDSSERLDARKAPKNPVGGREGGREGGRGREREGGREGGREH